MSKKKIWGGIRVANKKKRFGIFDWLTAIACGVISFCYFSSLGHDSKIVGPFLDSVYESVRSIFGENVTYVVALLSFFGSGFLMGWIIVWCLYQIDEKLGSRMKSKNNK